MSRITPKQIGLIEAYGRACWAHDEDEATKVLYSLIESFSGKDALDEIVATVEEKYGRSRPQNS